MKKTDNMPVAGVVLGSAVLIGLLVTLLLMAACAAGILIGQFSDAPVDGMACACLGAGALCAAFFAARSAGTGRFWWGLGAGAGLFACLIALSLAWFGEPIVLTRVMVNAGITVLCAAAGAVLGARQRKRRKHRK